MHACSQMQGAMPAGSSPSIHVNSTQDAKMKVKITREAGLHQLGKDIAMIMKCEDTLILSGTRGVGSSTLARAVIQAVASDDSLEVPSPPILGQKYQTIPRLFHFNLNCRLAQEKLQELYPNTLCEGCYIVECHDQHDSEVLPQNNVKIEVEFVCKEARLILIRGNLELMRRIIRSLYIREFLDKNGYVDASRSRTNADASTRRYELVSKSGEPHLFLMDAPEVIDGPPIKDGKPYAKLAHLAVNVTAFVAIDELLRSKGFAAPKIWAKDLDQGLLLIENLGDRQLVDEDNKPIDERYITSVEFLARMHGEEFQSRVQLNGMVTYDIPTYDDGAMMAEVELFLQWYLPHASEISASDEGAEFRKIWIDLFNQLKHREKTLVLRDFHSPNIIWRGDKVGTDRIGVIDFQDALIGPSAYDVASLGQDARVDVTESLERSLIDHYITCRMSQPLDFDRDDFEAQYAIMAAQRSTKILGIFVRLHERDGKPHYLRHLPRMRNYLGRSLRHPVLAEYKRWLEGAIKL